LQLLEPSELRRAGRAFTLSPMRDLDTIDSELRLLAAVRRSIREQLASRRVVRSTNSSTSA
jgi:hypothetical protein